MAVYANREKIFQMLEEQWEEVSKDFAGRGKIRMACDMKDGELQEDAPGSKSNSRYSESEATTPDASDEESMIDEKDWEEISNYESSVERWLESSTDYESDHLRLRKMS